MRRNFEDLAMWISISKSNRLAIVAAACFLLAGSLLAADKPRLPEGPGRDVTVKLCGTCHAAELVMNRRETVDGWNAVVVDMIMRGAKGTDEEFGEIVDYLVTHFPKTSASPKVNVNTAVAKDFVAKLGLPEEQASAIISHRETNGNFKSIEDLQKVPGVDAKLIEANKSKLEF
jgi:competence protein ComEA